MTYQTKREPLSWEIAVDPDRSEGFRLTGTRGRHSQEIGVTEEDLDALTQVLVQRMLNRADVMMDQPDHTARTAPQLHAAQQVAIWEYGTSHVAHRVLRAIADPEAAMARLATQGRAAVGG